MTSIKSKEVVLHPPEYLFDLRGHYNGRGWFFSFQTNHDWPHGTETYFVFNNNVICGFFTAMKYVETVPSSDLNCMENEEEYVRRLYSFTKQTFIQFANSYVKPDENGLIIYK